MKLYLFSIILIISLHVSSVSNEDIISQYFIDWDRLSNHQTFSEDTKKTSEWIISFVKKYADTYELYSYEAIETKILKNDVFINNINIPNEVLTDSRFGKYFIDSYVGSESDKVPIFFNDAYVGYGSGVDFLEARDSKKYKAIIRINNNVHNM